MPEIKNQSVTDLKIGKVIQQSDLPTPTGPESAAPKTAASKPAAAERSKQVPKPAKP